VQIDVNVDGLSHRIEVDKEPTEADVHEIASSLRQSDAYAQHEQANNLPPGILRAIAHQESRFNPDTKPSPTGVTGLMQITKDTWKSDVGGDYSVEPTAQIAAAGRILRKKIDRHGGDVRAGVSAYGDPNERDYVDKVFNHWHADGYDQPQQPAAQGGLVAAPSEAQAAEGPPAAAATPTSTAPPSTLAAHGRAALMQGFIKPAAHLNAVLNRWGAGTITPQEFNDYYTGLGFDPSALPTQAAESKIGQAFEAMAPLTALAPEIWGTGAAVAGLTDSHDIADGVEALIGGVQAGRAAIGLLSRAPDAARRLYAAAKGMRRTAAVAELGAETATAATRAATAEALAAAKDTAPSAGAQLRETLGVPEQVSTPEDAAAMAGKALTAVGRHRYELLPGEDVGIHGAASRLNTRVRQLFGHAESLAGKLAPVAADDGDVLQLQHGAGALLTEKGLTSSERELLERVESLGGGRVTTEPGPITIGGKKLNPRGTPEEQQLYAQITATPEGREAVEASRVLAMKPSPNAPRDMPSTMRLYGALRRAVLKPQEYPNLAGRGPARNSAYQLSNQLGDLIRSRTSADPEAFRAWERATRYVLEEQEPFRATVVKPVRGKAGLPQKALGSLLSRDSQPLERLVRNVSPSQRELYQRGLGMQIVERATEADGKISATKFRTSWNALPTRSRQIIASVQPEAAAALNDVIAGKRTWGEVAPVLNKAVEKVNAALDALGSEQRVTRQSNLAQQLGRKAGAGAIGTFARYHAIRAAFALATGHAASAAYQGGVWLLMRHPDLFISLVRSKAATPEQLRVLTAGLAAAMQPLDAATGQPASRPTALPSAVTSALQP
jgi:hypothetical protein